MVGLRRDLGQGQLDELVAVEQHSVQVPSHWSVPSFPLVRRDARCRGADEAVLSPAPLSARVLLGRLKDDGMADFKTFCGDM